MLFEDRRQAGALLARALEAYRGQSGIVLALPRGGVVVGREVAQELGLPLDVIITRKVGAPGNPEYAIGAVTETGQILLDDHVIAIHSIPRGYVEREVAHQQEEISRRKELYRGGRGLPTLAGRLVILVDDGVATGFTILAAIRAVRAQQPSRLVVAVPVAPNDAIRQLERDVDQVVCLASPEPFIAVGRWYQRFDQVTDEEVRSYLAAAHQKAS